MTSTPSLSESARDVGDGFRPKEAELVNHYLNKKISGYDQEVCRIPELNVYKLEPWDLIQHSGVNSNEQEWYFFHPNGGRPSRTTKNGLWKDTCRTRKVRHAEKQIGTKKTFVFHEGGPRKRVRTRWTIYEYSTTFNLHNQRAFVICKLFKNQNKKGTTPDCNEGELVHNMSIHDLEHQDHNLKSNNPTFGEDETSQVMTCENQATNIATSEEVDPQLLSNPGFFTGCNSQYYSEDPAKYLCMNGEQYFSNDDLWKFCDT
ncbi:transcription factor, putative [Ricinus communis]|uniref:Transcription factor, putative n=2 Tax=Ricinus communis TaxID=3988 RepID=B9S230_RICCO|nr:transcription factor, putative [Ricinus communis]